MTKKKDSYHHGDLRSTLLEVAAEMIAEKGAEGVTMRGLSQRVGVSRTAAYRHFADKGALLAAVAEEGFKRLAHHLQEEKEKRAEEDVLLRFRKMCVAYVDFAVKNPTHYRLMFGEKAFSWPDHPGLSAAAGVAFGRVMTIIRMCQQENKIKPGAPRELAYVVWAATHGLSSLIIDGRIRNTDNLEELIHLTVHTIFEGMKQ